MRTSLACLIMVISSLTQTPSHVFADLQSQPGYVSGEFVYPLEGRQTPQCHASTISETPTGLVTAWFGGKHEKNADVGIWVSRRVNGQWSRPVEVADGSEGEDKDYPCWNPVLFQPNSGPLMLFYKVGPNPREWWGMLMTSTDGGKTWSKMRKLGKDPAIGHLAGPIKNKPIQLSDGSILCGSSTEYQGWRVHFELSRDLGKTWQVIGPINDASKFNAIQPTILEHGNGHLQIMCRSRENVIATSWSSDGGKSWGPMTAANLPNPNAGFDALTLNGDRHLLIYNHTVRGGPFPNSRNMLNLASTTDGKSWSAALTFERDKGEYSYPAIIQTKDGLVHVTYTWRRQTVKHVVIDPTKLELTPIKDGKWPASQNN